MQTQTETKAKTKIPKKILDRRVRDENIEIEKIRGREADKGPGKKVARSKEEVRKQLRREIRQPKKKAEKPPFIILRDQKQLLAEPDPTIPEALAKSYIAQSKYGDGKIKDKGDLRQKNLYFSNVKACPREIYYKFFEPERARDYTVKGLILFDDGDRHHMNIQRRLEDAGKLQNPEGFLEIPEVGATGYYDGLINVGHENGWEICDLFEIKSKLPYACFSVMQVDYDQAQLYHFASQFSKRLKTKRKKVRNIRILYKDRAIETDDVHYAWMVKPDPERQAEILEYFRFLKFTVIDKQTLVPHPHEKSSKNCTYCRFKDWCWRGYPDKTAERKFDFEEAPLPEQEILDSAAKRFYEILQQESDIREEKKKLEPILLNYFLKTKKMLIPITEAEGLAPKQGRSTEWDLDGLRQAIGPEMFAKISKPEAKKITELIKQEFVDAAKFEQFKTYKPNKPSIYIKSIKGGENDD